MILATSAFLVAALASTNPAKALTGDFQGLCEIIDVRDDCKGLCEVVVSEGWFFDDWTCEGAETGSEQPGTDATEEEETVEEEAKEHGDVCNQHWDNQDACEADKAHKCVFIPSTSWFYSSECRTDACDLYAFDEEECTTSSLGCRHTPETMFYNPSCDPQPAPDCENLEGEFAHRSTADCSCGDIGVAKGSLACYADWEVVVATCEGYMDVDDAACEASKFCKLADQGWAASWFFVRECIPKEPEEIVEVETETETDVKIDVNGVEVEVETETDVKKAPSSRSSKKPSNNGKNGKGEPSNNGKGEEKNCGIYPCLVLEYKFYFIAALGAIAALLVMFIAMKCCSRRRAKE